jgi:flagellar M-ring protein FliF
MDVLNRFATQLSDLFKSMSPGARITTALLLVAVVVSLGYLFNTQSTGAEAYLLNGQSFTADEMSNMEAAFGKAGLSDYTVEGSRIRVTKSRQAAFLGAMADAGALPARFGDFLGQATAKAGPFTSRHEREEMMKNARQMELALVIRSMAGIENAAVHYDTQKQNGLRATTVATASVSVKPRGLQPLEESKVPMIRSLVAAAISGLQPDNVTVIDLNGGRAYSSKSGGIGSALDDPYLSRMREYQSLIESRVRDSLSHVPGIAVTANVELDREMVKNVEETKVDPKTVPLMSKTEENTLSSTSGRGSAGTPGLDAQQPQPNRPASLPGGGGGNSQTEDSRTKTENAFTASHGRTTTQLAGLTPKRTTVSIGIPSDYFEQVWQQRNPAADGAEKKKPDAAALTAIQDEETKKIRDHVAGLIPPPIDPSGAPVDPKTLVTVSTFTRVALTPITGPAFTDRALDWLVESWNTLAMIVLAVVALMMLRSFVASVPAPPELPTVHAATMSDDESNSVTGKKDATGAGGDAAPAKQRQIQRKTLNGPSLKEELVEMVREDPDAAANILRSWIGSTT